MQKNIHKISSLFYALNYFSMKKISWALLIFSAFIFECISLYFQHVLHLSPCVLCIYQRVAIFGILIAGVLGILYPTSLLIRITAIMLWLYCSYQGYQLATEQVALQFNPSFLNVCAPFVNFPDWLPLDKWLPLVFKANGDCSERVWQFLSLEMSQWMLVIFSSYIIAVCIILVAQFFPIGKKR